MTWCTPRFKNVGFLSFVNLVLSLLVQRPAFSNYDNKPKSVTGTQAGDDRMELSVNGTTAMFESGEASGSDIVEWTLDIEDDWLEDLLAELNEDDVLYDVGANLGVYSCFALNELDGGEVVAFEPYPPNYRQLSENLRRNGDAYRVIEKALSDERGDLEFTPTEDNSVGHATGTIAPDGSGSTTVIETVPGDRIIQERSLPQPDIVKVDVEGSEPLVLEGMTETLSTLPCRLLYCEIHLPKDSRPSVRDYGYTPEEVRDLVREAGFRITDETRRNQELHVKAER